MFVDDKSKETPLSLTAANTLSTSDLIDPVKSATPLDAVSANAGANDLDLLFRDNYKVIFRVAYRLTGSESDAEDVLQTILISHRDLVRLFALGKANPGNGIAVRDVMKTDLVTVHPDTPTLDALNLMRDKGIGALPVVSDRKLVGLKTAHDFLTVSSKLFDCRGAPAVRQVRETPRKQERLNEQDSNRKQVENN